MLKSNFEENIFSLCSENLFYPSNESKNKSSLVVLTLYNNETILAALLSPGELRDDESQGGG